MSLPTPTALSEGHPPHPSPHPPVVLVTGASQGIGAALASAFAEVPGARLALVSRNEARLEEVTAMIGGRGAQAAVFPCDVTDETAVERMTADVTARFGVPDVLVNNAGLFTPGSFREMSVDAFRAQVEVNLTSAFLVTRAFLDRMIQRRSGHVFFMGSVASLRGYPGGVGYCAAKHGVLGLARVVREETKPHGIRVTTLLPGATWTPSWDGTDEPETRFMPAEDIARAALDIWRMSPRTVVEEMLLRPQLGDL